MMRKILLALALLAGLAAPARAQQSVLPCVMISQFVCQPVSATNPFPVVIKPGAGAAYSAATVGTSSAQVLAAAAAKSYLMLANPAAAGTTTVFCAFGVAATVNGAGTLSIAPGQAYTWEGSAVPSAAINCIASGANAPFTLGVL